MKKKRLIVFLGFTQGSTYPSDDLEAFFVAFYRTVEVRHFVSEVPHLDELYIYLIQKVIYE